MKQDCTKILPLLSEMADGTLDANTSWKVKMHVSVCPDCARASQEIAGASQLVKGLAPRELPSTFDAALAARIASLSPKDMRRGRLAAKAAYVRRYYGWSLRLSAAALAAVLLFAAFVVRVPTRTTAPHSTPAGASTSDTALLAACLRQHHSYIASDPLADPSAQSLASQVDTALNPANGASPSPPASLENM